MMRPLIDRRLALFLLCSALAPWAGAATYYVGTSGSDSNPGTSAAPFASIQRGVNAAGPGDTVIVNDGTYGCSGSQDSMAVSISKAGTASAWITLEAAHPHAAILDGQLICHSYIDILGGAAYWVIKGLDIRNCRWGGIWSNSMGGKNMLIQNNWIHNIGNRSETASTGIVGIYTDNGASNFKIDGNTFWSNGRTSVLTGTHDHSIYSHGAGMIITNNVFYALMNGWHIQTAEGFGGTIANNTFYGPDPVAGTVGQVMLWGTNHNVIIRNNVFYAPTSIGITTIGLTISGGCTVDHNLVYNPGSSVRVFASLPSGCTETNEKVNVNPNLAAPSSYDFHETAGSPTIDAGVAISGVTTDFAGTARPQGSAFDIGAYEYAGSSSGGGGTTGGTGTGAGVGPAISGLGAGNVSSTGAAIVWTTNAAATSGVDYGRTTGYGSTVSNSTKVTSHSMSLSGLTSGSLYHYRARSTDASGDTATSGDATFVTSGRVGIVPAPAPPTTVIKSASVASTGLSAASVSSPSGAGAARVTNTASWQNVPLAPRTGTFTVVFQAKPSGGAIDGLIGLSKGAATSYASLAAAVRFNTAGRIDARNGGAYAASTVVAYSANVNYSFRLVINVSAHTYSAYVTPGSGTEKTIGLNYAFRSEQTQVASLDTVAMYSSSGLQTVCAVSAH